MLKLGGDNMEVWKDVYFVEDGVEWDYRGLYQVSNLGRVKSLDYNHTGKERMLKEEKDACGYLKVNLYKNGKRKHFKIHRLVAHLFCNGYFDGACVNHKDENKENNRADNLEWCTYEHNNNYGTRNEKVSKTLSKKVIGYSLTETKVIVLQSAKQGEKFGFNRRTISACCNGKRKSHKGYIWRYIEED